MRIQPLSFKHSLVSICLLMLAAVVFVVISASPEGANDYQYTAIEVDIDGLIERATKVNRYKKLRSLTIRLKATDRKLPDALAMFRQIHTLSILGKGEFCSTKVLSKMKHLKILHVSQLANSSLPEQVGELLRLQELHLIDCGYRNLPLHLSQLKELCVLDLSHNQLSLEYGQEELLLLPSLIALRLDHNLVTRFPYRLLDHSALECLSLNHCQVAHSNDSIVPVYGKESLLKEVYLDDNRLQDLPSALLDLPQLLHLSVAGNDLETLPENLYSWRFLRQLDVSNNQLSTFSEGVGLCNSLHYLDLSNNPLRQLPDLLGALYQLEYLNLAHTRLEQLPGSFRQLRSLQRLDLSGIRLFFTPEVLETLPKLEEVVVSTPRPRWTAELVKHRIQERFQQLPRERWVRSYSKLYRSPLHQAY